MFLQIVYRLCLKNKLAKIEVRYITYMTQVITILIFILIILQSRLRIEHSRNNCIFQKLDEAYIERKVLKRSLKKYEQGVLDEMQSYRTNLQVFIDHEKEVKKMLDSLRVTFQECNELNTNLRKRVFSTLAGLTSATGGIMAGVGFGAIPAIGVIGALSTTGIGLVVGGAVVGVGTHIYSVVSSARSKSEKERLARKAAVEGNILFNHFESTANCENS